MYRGRDGTILVQVERAGSALYAKALSGDIRAAQTQCGWSEGLSRAEEPEDRHWAVEVVG